MFTARTHVYTMNIFRKLGLVKTISIYTSNSFFQSSTGIIFLFLVA